MITFIPMIISLTTILSLLAIAELSRQVVHESDLSSVIKKLIGIDGESIGRWKKWGSLKAWWNLTGRWFFPLLPFITITVLFSWLMYFITNLFDCDRCFGFHAGWTLLYFFFGYTIIQSLVLAPLVIIFIYIIERIKR